MLLLASAVLGPCVAQWQFAATPYLPTTLYVTSTKARWGRTDAIDGNYRRLFTMVDGAYPGCFGGGFDRLDLGKISQETKRRIVRDGRRWQCVEDCNAADGYHFVRRVLSVHKTKRDAIAVYEAVQAYAGGAL